VRIHRESQISPQVHADDAGGFFAHAGQRFQRSALDGDLGAVFFNQGFSHGDEVFGFVAKQAQRANIKNQVSFFGPGIAVCVRKALKQPRRYRINAFVGTLRRQANRHQQLQRRFKMQRGLRVGEIFFEDRGDFFCLFEGANSRSAHAQCLAKSGTPQ